MSERYDDILEKINDIVKDLRQGESKTAYELINEQMPVINDIFIEVLDNINIFEEKGIDVSHELIMMQLNNMVDGLENKDEVKLADTLEYELSETIRVYGDIRRKVE